MRARQIIISILIATNFTVAAAMRNDDNRCHVGAGALRKKFTGIRVLREIVVGAQPDVMHQLTVVECVLGWVHAVATVALSPQESREVGIDFNKFICIRENNLCIKLARRKRHAWHDHVIAHRPGSLLGGLYFCKPSAAWTNAMMTFEQHSTQTDETSGGGSPVILSAQNAGDESGPEPQHFHAVLESGERIGLAQSNASENCQVREPLPLIADNIALPGYQRVVATRRAIVSIPLARTADSHDRYYAFSSSWAQYVDPLEMYRDF
jgi:hypothetical protein